MDKKNLAGRVLTCIVFPPLIFIVLHWLTPFSCVVPALVVFAVAIRASKETDALVFSNEERKTLPFWIPPILVMADWLGIHLGGIWRASGPVVLYLLVMAVAVIEAFAGGADDPPFRGSIRRMSKSILLIIYPNSFFMLWPEIMNVNNDGNMMFFFMLALVFANDVFCYVFGMLFGNGNRGYVKASPKKSLAGFIGGLAMTPVVGYACCKLIPAIGSHFESPVLIAVLSVAMALASDIGDIAESVIKRCGHAKDSGDVIPGRGGMLDNVDSILAASAMFLFFMKFVMVS